MSCISYQRLTIQRMKVKTTRSSVKFRYLVSENLDVDFGVRYEDYEADDIVVPKASAFL